MGQNIYIRIDRGKNRCSIQGRAGFFARCWASSILCTSSSFLPRLFRLRPFKISPRSWFVLERSWSAVKVCKVEAWPLGPSPVNRHRPQRASSTMHQLKIQQDSPSNTAEGRQGYRPEPPASQCDRLAPALSCAASAGRFPLSAAFPLSCFPFPIALSLFCSSWRMRMFSGSVQISWPSAATKSKGLPPLSVAAEFGDVLRRNLEPILWLHYKSDYATEHI